MYNEIYKAFVEILKKGPAEEVEYMKKDANLISKILAMNLNFKPEQIVRCKEIVLDNMPNILLVLGDTPNGSDKTKYVDYIIYNGSLVKVVLINLASLMSDNKDLIYNYLSWAVRECCIHITSQYADLVQLFPEKTVALSTILVYSSSILTVKLMDRLYDYSNMNENEKETHNKTLLKNILLLTGVPSDQMDSNEKFNPDTCKTVQSIRKALNDIGVENLMDNSMFLAADSVNYPDINFMTFIKYEDDEQNDKTI